MGETFTHLRSRVRSLAVLSGLFALSYALPSALTAQVTVVVTGTNITCFGQCNGYASAVGSGGWGPYTYQWSNGLTGQNIAGLCPGTYCVTATDMDLGYAVGCVTISEPPPLGVTVYDTSQICSNVPDGVAAAVPYGGTPPYTYLWNTGANTPIITGLAQGTYTVTVTDAHGCTVAGSVFVPFFNEGVWLMITDIDVTCYGLNNGSAHVSAMSGTPPYTYHWSNGQTDHTIFNLSPGTYTVTVTDANGCSNQTSTMVTQPDQLAASVTSTSSACAPTGSATVIPSGGTSPYSILWSNGQTGFTINNLTPGNYSVTVTDANGCVVAKNVTVIGGATLTVAATANTTAGCTVGGSATATVTAGGGSGSYAYTWDNGQNTAVATNLSAGSHSVTVTDLITGCVGTASVTITSAPSLVPSAAATASATCLIGGSATASASGGTPPYSFHWDNGQNTAVATNLGAGPHFVTVTDAAGCIATASVTIAQSQGPTVSVQILSNANCVTGGSAVATATGGTPGYVYLWDNGQTTATATNLGVGYHNVTVTDAAGCSATGQVFIAQPGAPTVVVVVTANAGCVTGGSISASPSGGTPGYTYLWSNGQTGATLINATPGLYTVTVTDAAGCTATGTQAITAPIPPTVVIVASSNATCAGPGSATASASGGGGGAFIYLWDNGETTATAVNLTAGVHTVTVTDGSSCTSSASVTIGSTNNGVKIGDYVWYDTDQDGFQDPQETNGVAGVTVMLIGPGPNGTFGNADDVTVASTSTNATGYYLFDCVPPGNYIIMFSGIPAGYQFSGKNQVPNDCKDSDANSNGKTDPFTVVSGQPDNLCYDAGIHIFCVNVTNAGIICCDQTICEGETPDLLYGVVPPSGGSGPIQYVWMQLIQIGPGPASWMGIPGANSADYQPGPLFETSYFMRCARREGCTTFLESNLITITVLPAGSPGCDNFYSNFVVQPGGGNTVSVSWTTGPEDVEYMYDVQHSPDQVNWTAVAVMHGQHNPNAPNDYLVMDENPFKGDTYYRIKRSSVGSVTYSEVKKLVMDLSAAQAIMISPNPIVDQPLKIRNVYAFDTDVVIDIMTLSGNLIYSFRIPAGSLQKFQLPASELPAGLYIARVRIGDEAVKTLKLTKF